MNTDPSRSPSFSLVPRVFLLAAGTVLLASSCTSTPTTDDNIFAPGKPRYGYGSPNAAPRTPAEAAAAAARKSDARKVPDIKRDPNNTTVDVTPPDAKPDRNTEAATTTETTETTESTTPPADSSATTEKPVEPETTETKPAVPTREDLPFGQPIVGKKGFVYSPYASDKGEVDVDGIPAGTKVKCPYTGKVFRVP